MASYTEAEARTKWCPKAQIAVRDGSNITTANRAFETGGTLSKHALCYGSDCLWWEWDPNVTDVPHGLTQQQKIERARAAQHGQQKPTHGYCDARRD